MSEPAPARRLSPESPVAVGSVVAGAVVLIILLLLLPPYFSSNDGGNRNVAPGPARSTSANPELPSASSPANRQPLPSARPEGPASPAGSPPATRVEPSGSARPRSTGPGSTATPGSTAAPGSTATPTSAPTLEGPTWAGAGPTPIGAPRTGGGSGPGMRSPLLLAAGILLVVAAAALVLFRAWPPDMEL